MTAGGARGRVLVVDDDADIRAMLGFALRCGGWEVAAAADGQAALDLLRGGFAARLVLLDLKMPGMNGSQFLAAKRADPALAPIAVVVLSGDGNLAQREAALGVAGCLRKPIEMETLLEVVSQHAG